MKKKSLEFYISYTYQNQDGDIIVASSTWKQDKFAPLTMQYIFDTLDEIKEYSNSGDITLLSFGRFEPENEEEEENEEM